MDDNKQILTKTLTVDPHRAKWINHFLTHEPQNASECFDEDNEFTITARFKDGFFVDVSLCGVQYDKGSSNTAWTQAVLYAGNGTELSCTDPEDEFFGEWEFEYNDTIYRVNVVAEVDTQNVSKNYASTEIVEVVRCRDCANYLAECCCLDAFMPHKKPTDFCSRAKTINDCNKTPQNKNLVEIEFAYILDFAKTTDFYYEVTRDQLRSLWTAYCIHCKYECDTYSYDTQLSQIWDVISKREGVKSDEICPWSDGNFDLFDMFMGELLS